MLLQTLKLKPKSRQQGPTLTFFTIKAGKVIGLWSLMVEKSNNLKIKNYETIFKTNIYNSRYISFISLSTIMFEER